MNQSTLVIKYPNGTKQVVKPGSHFKGDWQSLAQSIAGPYLPSGFRVIYELK